MAKKMDAFSASLMADKREIIFAPTVYKFDTFAQLAEEFKLNERDVVLTNEFIYTPFMKDLGLKCQFVFQEKFGAGEPSEEMIQTMFDAIPYESYDRVIAVGGGAIMDLCKLLGCQRPDTVHNLFFKRFPVVHEKEVIAIPTTCGTGSECTNISVAIVTAENHNTTCGLGSVVANCLAKNCPTVQEFVGVQDLFGEVGPQNYLMDRFGLRAPVIVDAVKKAIARK